MSTTFRLPLNPVEETIEYFSPSLYPKEKSMSTVLEKPLVNEVEPAPFVPPPIKMNQEVSWYPLADRNKEPACSRVTKVARSVITVVTIERYGNIEHESVRHIDDPFLANNSHWRSEYGAWDYTPEYKDRLAFEARVEARLKAIESASIAPVDADGILEALSKRVVYVEKRITGLLLTVGRLKKTGKVEEAKDAEETTG